uniref:Putative secreted protein n=1 Tax=Anopheles darlingi TaxID=43151 RepID=A0A2M4DAD8_ANODA
MCARDLLGFRMGNRVGRVWWLLLLLQTKFWAPCSTVGMVQELKDKLCDVYVTLMNCLVLLEKTFLNPDKRSK